MQKQLSDGLLLRSLSEGHASDRENLGRFYQHVFGEANNPDSDALGAWSGDLMADHHPTTTLDDLWVVVDPAKEHQIVSALLLIPQTWRYEEIELGVGRVELVATHKDYRRRGLVRTLMNVAHERSANLGHIMQGITGIPHYYRRFGYSMAVDLGTRIGLSFDALPKLKEDEQPKYTLRPATEDDIPNLIAWDAYYAKQCLLTTVRDAQVWRYELHGKSEAAPFCVSIQIIVNAQGEDVGYTAVRLNKNSAFFAIFGYVVGEKSSYLDTFDDVMRGLKSYAESQYQEDETIPSIRIGFDSGISETVDMLVNRMPSGVVRQTVYAWYIRVEHIARLVLEIRPVLERRLRDSGANAYAGELKINFYDMTGLTLKFENGHITDVLYGEMEEEGSDTAFPYHLFLNVLFGHRTLEEIQRVLPETYANRKAGVLLSALFPPKRSWLMPLT